MGVYRDCLAFVASPQVAIRGTAVFHSPWLTSSFRSCHLLIFKDRLRGHLWLTLVRPSITPLCIWCAALLYTDPAETKATQAHSQSSHMQRTISRAVVAYGWEEQGGGDLQRGRGRARKLASVWLTHKVLWRKKLHTKASTWWL